MGGIFFGFYLTWLSFLSQFRIKQKLPSLYTTEIRAFEVSGKSSTFFSVHLSLVALIWFVSSSLRWNEECFQKISTCYHFNILLLSFIFFVFLPSKDPSSTFQGKIFYFNIRSVFPVMRRYRSWQALFNKKESPSYISSSKVGGSEKEKMVWLHYSWYQDIS